MPSIGHIVVQHYVSIYAYINGYTCKMEDKAYQERTDHPHRPDCELRLKKRDKVHEPLIFVECQRGGVTDAYKAKCEAQYAPNPYVIIDIDKLDKIRFEGGLVNSSVALYYQIDAQLDAAAIMKPKARKEPKQRQPCPDCGEMRADPKRCAYNDKRKREIKAAMIE
jgi:hypothetical protein